jgi:protein-tyrosine phosphatase
MEIDERLVPLEAVFNFRDVGGYETVDGRRVRAGVVYRSGPLQRMTAADLERVLELGVRTVIDLRASDELSEWGRFPETDTVDFRHLPFYEHDVSKSTGETESAIGNRYAQMAVGGSAAIATALRVIAERDEAIVFHCGSGKDRTGILTALLLSTLGVPDASIGTDYELSELALAPSIAWAEANDVGMAAALAELPPWKRRSSPASVRVLLDRLREGYGSIDAFLGEAGVTPEVLDSLRARLLEP